MKPQTNPAMGPSPCSSKRIIKASLDLGRIKLIDSRSKVALVRILAHHQ